MPTESLIVVVGVVAAFAFFSAVVIFGDLTWRGAGEPDAGAKEKA